MQSLWEPVSNALSVLLIVRKLLPRQKGGGPKIGTNPEPEAGSGSCRFSAGWLGTRERHRFPPKSCPAHPPPHFPFIQAHPQSLGLTWPRLKIISPKFFRRFFFYHRLNVFQYLLYYLAIICLKPIFISRTETLVSFESSNI